MKSLLLLVPIILTWFLTSCAPGVRVYGAPQTISLGNGRVKVVTNKLVELNADVIGDIEIPNRLKITTAKDAAGNPLYTETPVTQKDGTVVMAKQPMVAQVKVSSVWDSLLRGASDIVAKVGQFAMGTAFVGGPSVGAIRAIP